LPAEIRNDIWKLVLGGKIFRTEGWGKMAKLATSPADHKKAMSLLRTCRQIYAEAASMPLTLNNFSFEFADQAGKILRKFPGHKRQQISSLQFEMRHPNHVFLLDEAHLRRDKFSFPKLLPGLKELFVYVFSAPTSDKTETQKTEDKIRQLLAPSIRGTQIDVKVEQTELMWAAYDEA
jgi:hypothetical protein